MASSGPSQILLSLAHNADAAIKNNPRSVSREAPEVVVELSGSFPARTSKRKLFSFPPQLGPREVTLEALQEQLSGLAEVLWLKGVLFRAAGLQLDLTTAGALRNQLEILKGADKQVSIYLTRLDLISYYLASDLIWREVVRIKRSKPVVAVMGGVTASGGYYVLTHAAQVIASPTTLTGSIGVLTGKFVLEGFNTLYGFNSEALSRGRFALSTSAARPFSRKERALQERSIAEIYERFTSRVAAGRGLTQAQVDELGWGVCGRGVTRTLSA